MQNNTYVFLAIPIITFLLWFLWFFPRWQAEKYREKVNKEDLKKLKPSERINFEKDLSLAENSFRTTLAQVIGGLVILGTLIATAINVQVAQQNTEIAQKNLLLSEQGKLTDRFREAVGMLGSDKLEIRLGGIYALERISIDSDKHHWTVIEVLTAFIRENSDKKLNITNANTSGNTNISEVKFREDIQAIMTVIGRRRWRDTEIKDLDLQTVYLTNGSFKEGKLKSANFKGANLTRTNFSHADLTNAVFGKADLSEADLTCADLTDTDLTEAYNLTIQQLIKSQNYYKPRLSSDLRLKLYSYTAAHPELTPRTDCN